MEQIAIQSKLKSESDFMPARASPSGFTIPYNFCGFARAGICFHVEYTPPPSTVSNKLLEVNNLQNSVV